MKKNCIVLWFILSPFFAENISAANVAIRYDKNVPQLAFAIEKVEIALHAKGHTTDNKASTIINYLLINVIVIN